MKAEDRAGEEELELSACAELLEADVAVVFVAMSEKGGHLERFTDDLEGAERRRDVGELRFGTRGVELYGEMALPDDEIAAAARDRGSSSDDHVPQAVEPLYRMRGREPLQEIVSLYGRSGRIEYRW